jgi:Cys-tRNA(Pro)/Cys-tRNA(Cys) deacylase
MKTPKTNAARILDQHKIPYELIPYEVDEDDLSAIHVAEQLGEPIAAVFKTLVLRGDKSGIFVCIIPGAEEVDLKKAAKATGNKNSEMIAMKELLPLTGYIRGGCSPLSMKKAYPTLIDDSCLEQPFVYISAGVRGLQIKLSPSDLINVVQAKAISLTK